MMWLLVLPLLAVMAFIFWPVRREKIFIGIAAVFFIGVLGMYRLVGAPEIVPLLEEREVQLAALKESIVDYSGKVKANPKDLEAWIGLGADFMKTGQYAAAANAFKRSVVLSQGNPTLILAYAKATILAADGKVDDHAKKSLEMVLLQEPENPEARYYIIVRKLQDGDAKNAMAEMKALYRSLPENSPLKAMIDAQIGR